MIEELIPAMQNQLRPSRERRSYVHWKSRKVGNVSRNRLFAVFFRGDIQRYVKMKIM